MLRSKRDAILQHSDFWKPSPASLNPLSLFSQPSTIRSIDKPLKGLADSSRPHVLFLWVTSIVSNRPIISHSWYSRGALALLLIAALIRQKLRFFSRGKARVTAVSLVYRLSFINDRAAQ